MDGTATLDLNGMEVLDERACFARLGRNGLGRVAVTIGALPAIFPVTYAVDGRDLYFRTGPGTKLAAASRNAVVAFEVDSFDAMGHAGWSVLVVGPAAEVTDPDELVRLEHLPLRRWVGAAPGALVCIRAARVSGRALRP